MPFYLFECTDEDCGHQEERLVKAGVSETECSICGSLSEKNMIGSMLFSSTGLPNGHNSLRKHSHRK